MRISDILGRRIEAAIEALPVLAVTRDQIDWEIAPALLPRGAGMILAYMVAVSIPVPGSVDGDKVLYMAPLDDPDASQETVNALVAGLHQKAEQEAGRRRDQIRARANGHKESPGGLIVP